MLRWWTRGGPCEMKLVYKGMYKGLYPPPPASLSSVPLAAWISIAPSWPASCASFCCSDASVMCFVDRSTLPTEPGIVACYAACDGPESP